VLSQTSLTPGDVVAGKYRVEALLGRGGMGEVFSAIHEGIGRRVAVKVLALHVSDDTKDRFELEAQAAGLIGHPGIVDVLDVGLTQAGEPYMVMEHLEGLNLEQLFEQNGPMEPAIVVAAVAPVLDALAAAHAVGVVHRDIKPANVFVCAKPERVVKLLDFGVSRFAGIEGITRTGIALGTPRYMAPEQALDAREAGPAADLFAIGSVLYRGLAGRAPLENCRDLAAVARALRAPQASIATMRQDAPRALCALVDELLLRDPHARPGNAAEVARRLRDSVAPDDDALFELVPETTHVAPIPQPRISRPRAPVLNRAAAPAVAPAPEINATIEEPADATVIGQRTTSGLFRDVVLKRALIGVAVLVLLGVVVAVSFVVSRPPLVDLKLEVSPVSAHIVIDGVEHACNPCRLTGPEGSTVEVELSADGFEPRRMTLLYRKGRQLVKLTPLRD
jgi:serine/threonine-protein kinase